MKEIILLVTWFYYGQPPSSYQQAFTSTETCEAAKGAVLSDAQRLAREATERAYQPSPNGVTPIFANPVVPTVSAVCVAR
jgi:hypothetical protein